MRVLAYNGLYKTFTAGRCYLDLATSICKLFNNGIMQLEIIIGHCNINTATIYSTTKNEWDF